MFAPLVRVSLLIASALAMTGPALAVDSDNAADLYRAALKATPTSAEDLATFKADNPSQEAIAAVLAKGADALKLLHDAAGKNNCDWQIDPTKKAFLGFLNSARYLSELAKFQAEANIAVGKKTQAAAVLSDAMIAGRRIAQMEYAVPMVVGQAFEISAMNSAAQMLPLLDDDSVAELSKTFAALPAPASIDAALAAEKRLSGEDLKPGGADRLKENARHCEVVRALFAAALKAPHGGAEDFASTKDPEGGKPFNFRPTANGYELSSAMEFKGKVVTLTVGKPDAEN